MVHLRNETTKMAQNGIARKTKQMEQEKTTTRQLALFRLLNLALVIHRQSLYKELRSNLVTMLPTTTPKSLLNHLLLMLLAQLSMMLGPSFNNKEQAFIPVHLRRFLVIPTEQLGNHQTAQTRKVWVGFHLHRRFSLE
jgi:hypothetical protein